MSDSLEALRMRAKVGALRPTAEPTVEEESDAEEECCAAFGFLRGLQNRAITIEFRLANGNSRSFPLAWLGPIIYNPSLGLLLQFVGDISHWVLIEGSNLNATATGAVNLYDRGILRHRITWVKEMSRSEAGKAKPGEVIIDRIRIASLQPNDDLKGIAWLEPFNISG